jgi:hypothetical protein
MKKTIEEIFVKTLNQKEILANVNLNLMPILQERNKANNQEEFLKKLSFCAGYHIKKVETLRAIIFSYFTHNTINRNLNKKRIFESIDGIIYSEAGENKIIEAADSYYKNASFKSNGERDASYIMTCIRFIIESCLMINFMEYVSNNRSNVDLPDSPDKSIEIFSNSIGKYVNNVFESIMKSIAKG